MGNINLSCACNEEGEPPFSQVLYIHSPEKPFIHQNPLFDKKREEVIYVSDGYHDDPGFDIETGDLRSDESVMTLISPTKDRTKLHRTKPPRRPSSLSIIPPTITEGIALEMEAKHAYGDMDLLEANDDIFKAIVIGDIEQLQSILYSRQLKISNICWKSTGYSALHIAVIEERVDMIDFALAQGVNVCHKDKLGRTALHLCYLSTNIAVIEALISYLDTHFPNQVSTPLSPYARSSQRNCSPQSGGSSLTVSPTEPQSDDEEDEDDLEHKEDFPHKDDSMLKSQGDSKSHHKGLGMKRMMRKAAGRMRRALQLAHAHKNSAHQNMH